MKPERLGNLLREIDKRLIRIEDSLRQAADASSSEVLVRQPLFALKAEVRRFLSKVESMREPDLLNLERMVDDLREAAGRDMAHNSPARDPLAAVFHDEFALRALTAGLRIGINQIGPDEVLEAVPGQKTAAFQFGFSGDVLVVVDQSLRPNDREKEMALAALEAAIEHGEYVNEDIATTNVSPRLKDAFLRLQGTMATYKNIVQVGARAQICNRLVQSEADELSPSLFGLLLGHIEAVFSALAQFEEWRIYSENAASLPIDADTAKCLASSTRILASHLRSERSADTAVADALEAVANWVDDQNVPDKRDVLSLSRTLENIWSVVSKSVLAIGRETVAVGRVAAAGLILGVLLMHAEQVVPVISKVPGAEWIQTAYNYLKAGGSHAPGK